MLRAFKQIDLNKYISEQFKRLILTTHTYTHTSDCGGGYLVCWDPLGVSGGADDEVDVSHHLIVKHQGVSFEKEERKKGAGCYTIRV